MTPIHKCIIKRDKKVRPIWIMRQAGRYLPEFRSIRKRNKDFIKLCLNKKEVTNITLQPLKRFKLDAAIIFSDILMVPFGLGQNVKFLKNYGPKLNNFNLDKIKSVNKREFYNNLKPVYDSIKNVSKYKILKNKDLIGFSGSPWTILVYMINKSSPKNNFKYNFYKDKSFFHDLFEILYSNIKIHIYNQIKSGATLIQLFDSWAGLVDSNHFEEFILKQNKRIVDYTKSLNTPVICFPKGIHDYKTFLDYVKPDVISIDYKTDPEKILKFTNIPIQGGIDPKLLLGGKKKLETEVNKFIEIFKNHPYIFNLGHGILPETDPKMVEYFIKLIKGNK